jgi:hypothetical protein
VERAFGFEASVSGYFCLRILLSPDKSQLSADSVSPETGEMDEFTTIR